MSFSQLGFSRAGFLSQIGHGLRAPWMSPIDIWKLCQLRLWNDTRLILGVLAGLILFAAAGFRVEGEIGERVTMGFALVFLSWGFFGCRGGAAVLATRPKAVLAALSALGLLWFSVIPWPRAFPELIWIVGLSAVGEELFFRGYVQSRWNQVFGRPWRVGATQFGLGLILAAVLFGVVHLINPWDYFSSTGDLAWSAAIMSACSLYLGITYERTGSVIGPITLHALGNILIRILREVAA
jgi:membrane protease YdiL (CAAX protease family)